MAKLILVTIIGLLKVISPMLLHGVMPVTNDEDVKMYTILVTHLCSRTSFNRSQTCQTNDFQLHKTIEHCGFQALCKSGYQARCINTQEGGMAHICVEINLSCEAGVWRKAWVDKQNESIIRTQDEECPNDRFQPAKSNCFDACEKEHLDLNDLPERYLVYSKGNKKSPTHVYCNYKKGYVNPSNKTLLNYDLEGQYNQLFCMDQKKIELWCEDNEILLPNGTCVCECRPWECRDDHDKFICKQNCSLNGGDVDSQETEQNKGGTTKIPEITTEIKDTEQSPKDTKFDTIHIIIIVLSVIAIATSTVIVVKCCNRTGNAPLGVHGRGTSSINDGNPTEEFPETVSLCNVQTHEEQFRKLDDNTYTQPILNSLNEQMKFVGALIRNGVVQGTVFRVGSKYVMTAYHVIKPIICDEVSNVTRQDRLYNRNIFVNFNAAAGDSLRVHPYIKKIKYINVELDVVILELTTLSGVPDKMLLFRGDRHIVIEKVTVIGFGNPSNQMEKHFDPNCTVIQRNGIEIQNALQYYETEKDNFRTSLLTDPKAIEDGYRGCDDNKNILFHGFMEHGASGAPILFCNDARYVYVVGVLTHGIPGFFYKLPKRMQKDFPSKLLFHKGCRMQFIYQDLMEADEQLAKDIFCL